MRFSFVGKHNVVTEKLKKRTEEKLSKLSKFLPEDVDITVSFKVTKLENKIEVTFYAYKRSFRAEAKDLDMYNALDRVVDVIEQQLRKLKSRLNDKSRREKLVQDAADSDEIIEAQQVITKIKTLIKPMEVEDAIMEMELLSYYFHVFRNIETDEINVVYKRNEENSYGIIEP